MSYRKDFENLYRNKHLSAINYSEGFNYLDKSITVTEKHFEKHEDIHK